MKKRSNERVMIWVDPSFRKWAKKKAADNEVSTIRFLEELPSIFEEEQEKRQRKMREYGFKL